MDAIFSLLFCILCFPHEGRIVTVDQMEHSHVDQNAFTDLTIPLVNDTKKLVENLGVGMYTSLMGTFYLPPPWVHIHAISSFRFPT